MKKLSIVTLIALCALSFQSFSNLLAADNTAAYLSQGVAAANAAQLDNCVGKGISPSVTGGAYNLVTLFDSQRSSTADREAKTLGELKNISDQKLHSEIITKMLNSTKERLEKYDQYLKMASASKVMFTTAQAKYLSQYLELLEHNKNCKNAILIDHNAIATEYMRQVALYSAGGAGEAVDQIEDILPTDELNEILKLIGDDSSDLEEVNPAVEKIISITEQFGSTEEADANRSDNGDLTIPLILKAKWACANAFRAANHNLRRPISEGGMTSIGQAVVQFERLKTLANSLQKSCASVFENGIYPRPNMTSEMCSKDMEFTNSIIAYCKSARFEQSTSLKSWSLINTAYAYPNNMQVVKEISGELYAKADEDMSNPKGRSAQAYANVLSTENLSKELENKKHLLEERIRKLQKIKNGYIIDTADVSKSINKMMDYFFARAYASTPRSLQIVKKGTKIVCLLGEDAKGACSSVQQRFSETEFPGNKHIEGRLDKVRSVTGEFIDKIQGKTHINEEAFQLMDTIEKEGPKIVAITKELEQRIKEHHEKNDMEYVSTSKRTNNILASWQNIVSSVMAQAGKIANFAKKYTAIPIKTRSTKYRKSNKKDNLARKKALVPVPRHNKTNNQINVDQNSNYVESLDYKGELKKDANINHQNSSLFKSISTKYQKRLFMLMD